MLTTPERLNEKVTDLIAQPSTDLLLSAASSWEIAIKWAIGRLPLPEAPETYVPVRMQLSGVEALPVTHSHALRVAALEAHHHDPFDRVLVAQTKLEGLTLISADPIFERYGVELISAS